MSLKNCTSVLFVNNAAKSRDFYVNVLGMNVVMSNGDLNFFFKEGFAIWQVSEDNEIPKRLGYDVITDINAANRFEMCFETENIDEVFQHLKNNNVSFLHEINTEMWGQRTIRFYDPDNHLIEVGESMHIFLNRVYEEEKHDIEATSRRTFTPVEAIRYFLGMIEGNN
jgi:catechol 2,3-dioxygenase-like lactoylglutathione lyase family enzyme